MSKHVKCVACQDSGRNSKGGVCIPCHRMGREPVKDVVLQAVKDVFADAWHDEKLPSDSAVRKAVDWALQPRISFVVGWRDKDRATPGLMATHEPSTLTEMLCVIPDTQGVFLERKFYIAKITCGERYTDEFTYKPVARWKNGKWKQKKLG